MGLSNKALARGIAVTLFVLLIVVAISKPFIGLAHMSSITSPVASVENTGPNDQNMAENNLHIDRMQTETSDDSSVSTTQVDTALNSDTICRPFHTK